MTRKILRALRAVALLWRKRAWGPFVEASEATHFDHAFSVSWAQAGEDIALELMLGNNPSGRYLDIGAHHPSRFSVTRKLHQAGWSGLNVDANAELIELFDRARPNDVNICAAVGDLRQYEFTVFQEPAISTVDADWERRFVAEGQTILRRDVVAGVTLRELLDTHFPESGPDLLTIDIEGADEMALRSGALQELDPARRPSWILLETSPPVAVALGTPAVALALSLGYEAVLVLPMATLLRRLPESR